MLHYFDGFFIIRNQILLFKIGFIPFERGWSLGLAYNARKKIMTLNDRKQLLYLKRSERHILGILGKIRKRNEICSWMF